MKKTLLRTLISTAIIVALPIGLVSATAAPGDPIISPSTSNTSPITAEVTETYTVTIPTGYTFTSLAPSASDSYVYEDGTVTVSTLSIAQTNYLHVQFGTTTDSDYNLTNTSATLPFDIYSAHTDTTKGTVITHGAKVLNVNYASNEAARTAPCHVGINLKDINASGSYSGSLTFTISTDTSPT